MKKQSRFPSLLSYWYPVVAGLVLVALGVSAYQYHRQNSGSPTPTPTPSVTASTQPTPTPTSTASPSPSVSPSATASSLPSAVGQEVSQFYASYKAKDRQKLGTYFTADTTTELRSLHSQLFKGTDLSGNPGGPTLFSNNAVMEYATSYAILSSTSQGSNWVVTVKEVRTEDGVKTVSETTVLTLAQESGNWKVDSYTHQGAAGKYNGFYTP